MALFSNPEKEYEKAQSLVFEMLNARANGQSEKAKRLSDKAADHMLKAAEGGHGKAMYRMAIYKTYGSIETCILSVPKDGYFYGLSWLQKAADGGYLYAILDLGVYYYLNSNARDLTKSAELLEKAYRIDRKAALADLISLYTYEKNVSRLTELLDGACPGTESDLRIWPYTRQLADLRREQGRADCKPLYQVLAAIPDRHSLLRLGEMEESVGNVAGAVEYYKKAYLSADANLPSDFVLSSDKHEFYQRALRLKNTTPEALQKKRSDTPEANLARCAAANKGITWEGLFQWYQTLAERGNPSAKSEVAWRYLYGNGVAKNPDAALSVLKELKDSGKASRNDLAVLGNIYTEKKQYEDALGCFDAAGKIPVSLGDTTVYYGLNQARCFYELKNYAAAFPLLRQFVNLAEKPNSWALFAMGYCYHSGYGVAKNDPEAFRCYEKSFEVDPQFAKPAYNLGIMYETGNGVKKNISLAREWYAKAAALGYKLAQSRIDVLDAAEKVLEESRKNTEAKPITPTPKPAAKPGAPRSAPVKKTGGYSARKELDSLIGLDSVKKEIEMLEAVIKGNALRRSQGLPEISVSLNMIFTGNAGTGKTTVARIVANILKENGLLAKGQLVETDRGGLVGRYIGETAPKTAQKVEEAMGGVLFIDEVYSLSRQDSGSDFGPEAVSTLIKLMEDRKGEFAVIIAGYEKEMKEFIDSNSGLKSRFPTVIHFPDYTPAEMQMIFDRMCKTGNYIVSGGAKEKLLDLWQKSADYSNLGNGRAVRNVFEKVQKLQVVRVLRENITSGDKLRTFEADDIPGAEEVFN